MAPKALEYCLCVVRWTPVVFIVSVIVWSYYAYVVQMCLFTIDSILEKVIYLILFHPIIFIFLWCYWRTILTEPGHIPKNFYLSSSQIIEFEGADSAEAQNAILNKVAQTLPVQCRTSKGDMRYCDRCHAIKPDRAHHCSVCGRCVLKMDHHCPWVNNCVNFTNYKYFVLFLGWGLVYCIFVAGTSAQYFIRFWNDMEKDMNNLHIVFLFFAGVMFAISLVSLFGYHLYLTAVNRSTLESFRAPIFRSGPDKDGFSLGTRANFQEVFGDDRWQYLIPTNNSHRDGVDFPTPHKPESSVANYNSMDNTAVAVATTEASKDHPTSEPSFGDGVTFPTRTVDEDYDTLLGDRQRWMEEGEENGYDNSLSSRM